MEERGAGGGAPEVPPGVIRDTAHYASPTKSPKPVERERRSSEWQKRQHTRDSRRASDWQSRRRQSSRADVMPSFAGNVSHDTKLRKLSRALTDNPPTGKRTFSIFGGGSGSGVSGSSGGGNPALGSGPSTSSPSSAGDTTRPMSLARKISQRFRSKITDGSGVSEMSSSPRLTSLERDGGTQFDRHDDANECTTTGADGMPVHELPFRQSRVGSSMGIGNRLGLDDIDDDGVLDMATRGSLHATLNANIRTSGKVMPHDGGDGSGKKSHTNRSIRRASTVSGVSNRRQGRRNSLLMMDTLRSTIDVAGSPESVGHTLVTHAEEDSPEKDSASFAGDTVALQSGLPFYILDPDGIVCAIREVVVIFASYVTCVVLPPVLVLEALYTPASIGINMGLDAVFILNVVINFLTLPPALESDFQSDDDEGASTLDAPVLEYRREGWWCIARYYIYHGGAPLDLVAAIPWEIIALIAGGGDKIPAFPAFVCTRFVRVKAINLLSSETNVGMLVRLMVSLFFVGHTLGILWWLISLVQGFPKREFFWIHGYTYIADVQANSTDSFSDFMHNYIYLLFWGMRCCATFASDLVPESFLDNVLCLVAIMVGLAFFAYVLGDIFDVISSIKAKSKERRENLAAVLNWFETRNFDKELQSRLLSHKLLHVNTYKGYSEADMLKGLPQTLVRDITFSTRSPMLLSNKMFRLLNKTEDRGLIGPLCEALEPEVTVGGEIILTAGEEGANMYWIQRGIAHVVRHEAVLATLRRGDFFGEVAIILQSPRIAHVASLMNMELFSLKASDLEHLMTVYKVFKDALVKVARERFEEAAKHGPARNSSDGGSRGGTFVSGFTREGGGGGGGEMPTSNSMSPDSWTNKSVLNRADSRAHLLTSSFDDLYKARLRSAGGNSQGDAG